MATKPLYIRPLPSWETVGKFVQIMKSIFSTHSVDNFYFDTQAGQYSVITSERPIECNKLNEDQRVQSAITLLHNSPYLEVRNIYIRTGGGIQLSYINGDSEPAYITVGGDAFEQMQISQRIAIIDEIGRHFNLISHTDVLRESIPKHDARVLDYFEKTIGDFATQAAKLSQLSAENTAKLSEKIMAQSEALETKYRQKDLELEGAIKVRKSELDTKEQQLREKEAVMDTRENTAVRRELFEKIQKIIEEQKEIVISDNTLRKRRPIVSVCQMSLTLSFAIICTFTVEYLQDKTNWHLLLPVSGGLALFVTTSVFYIKWNDKWFAEHAAAEFQNRKFKSDIARASWIAELLFEDKKRETQLPAELIASFTTNLFQDSEKQGTKHPYENLAEMMKSLSSLKLGKAGIEITKNQPKV